jgi:hypothetical protein
VEEDEDVTDAGRFMYSVLEASTYVYIFPSQSNPCIYAVGVGKRQIHVNISPRRTPKSVPGYVGDGPNSSDLLVYNNVWTFSPFPRFVEYYISMIPIDYSRYVGDSRHLPDILFQTHPRSMVSGPGTRNH